MADLFPTRSVVSSFGEHLARQSPHHHYGMDVEGVALVFLAALVASVTLIDSSSMVSSAVYMLSSLALLVLAAVSVFTGFRVSFFPFKVCPFLFTAAAILILHGSGEMTESAVTIRERFGRIGS